MDHKYIDDIREQMEIAGAHAIKNYQNNWSKLLEKLSEYRITKLFS
jgi:hypothetical protein